MILFTTSTTSPRKAVWGPKLTLLALALTVLAWPLTAAAAPKRPTHLIKGHHKVKQTPKVHRARAISRHRAQPTTVKPGLPNSRVDHGRLDGTLQKKKATAGTSKATVDVIATLNPGQSLPRAYTKFVRRCFPVIGACELDGVPVKLLPTIEQDSRFQRVSSNHATRKTDVLSNTAVQANALAAQFGSGTGYTGAGVGVAFIDSGFTSTPLPDLTDDRVTFVDFVDPTNTSRIDLDGHGTHVAGIVGGTGTLDAKETGIAPGTSIVSLRVLDEQGNGSIGDIIAALDWVGANYLQYNIRVVSMSVGAGVYESYWTDPLTLAAKALVDKGITVVAAAGNVGKNASGQLQWGGITSPGVAPWVLTTCAFSTMGTPDTSDDVMADFSSSGPAYIDFTAKPDICAPGVGIVSLAAPEGRLAQEGAQATPSWLVDAGTNPSSPFAPYLVLTGTSQATPFVTGTVALMLQANPNLTPNLIKAILQYTASSKPGVSLLRQGGGFMNTLGAVTLAQFYATAQPGAALPIDPSWSRSIDWGNQRISGGVLDPTANAWTPGVEWGWAYTQGAAGSHIAWGTDCGGLCDNIAWGTDDDGDNIVWGTDDNDNIVWGTDDGDNIVWGTDDGDNIVWGTSDDGDNIVWGTDDDSDNIVWGTDCGGDDCDNIVWGTDDSDNIVWGTDDDNDNIVWGTDDGDNIVWGTDDDGDNIVWGTSDESDNVVWPQYR